MVSLVSGEASAHGHLHLDPTLEVAPRVRARCATCMPIKTILRRIFCCCASNCCNTTTINRPSDPIIYVCKDGKCVLFDPSKSDNPKEDYKKTAERVKSFVESEKKVSGSVITEKSGVDLDAKLAHGEPLRAHELKRLQSI